MGGTKIFVLQMKDVIRIAAFALLGLVLIALLVILFIPKHGANAPGGASMYTPGKYSSSIILYDQPVDVSVTVSDNEITAVNMTEMAEIQRVFYPLFEPAMDDLAAEVLQYQSADIVPQTEAPVTTDILRQAVSAALLQASAEQCKVTAD